MAHPGVIIHHSASPTRFGDVPVGVGEIASWHRERGFHRAFQGRTFHVAYHFVIRTDGVIETGRPLGVLGGHTASSRFNRYVGICLVGDFTEYGPGGQPHPPLARQLDSLIRLLVALERRFGFRMEEIRPHGAVAPTDCPGGGVDIAWIRAQVARHSEIRPLSPDAGASRLQSR